MPCRNYESDDYDDEEVEDEDYEGQADKLARIACKAMTALEAMGKEDFLLLQDDEVREWWSAHKEADRQARAAEEAKARALAKLSDEEKILLGLKKL
jgi:hypothetical protein